MLCQEVVRGQFEGVGDLTRGREDHGAIFANWSLSGSAVLWVSSLKTEAASKERQWTLRMTSQPRWQSSIFVDARSMQLDRRAASGMPLTEIGRLMSLW